MEGMAVTQQSPVPLRRENQIQEMGTEDTDEEVVSEEVVAKYMEE